MSEPQKNRLRTLVFDCGDTLLHLDPPRALICHEVVLELGHSIPVAAIERAYRVTDQLRPQPASQLRTRDDKSAYYSDYNRRLAEQLGIATLADGLDRRLQQVFARRRKWSVSQETRGMLAALADRYLLYVLANWDAGLELLLQRLELAQHFEGVFDSESLGAEKPAAEIFDAFCGQSGVVPSEALYIGNDYLADVVGPRGAGFAALLFDPGGHYEGELDCPRVASWLDLPGRVEELSQESRRAHLTELPPRKR